MGCVNVGDSLLIAPARALIGYRRTTTAPLAGVAFHFSGRTTCRWWLAFALRLDPDDLLHSGPAFLVQLPQWRLSTTGLGMHVAQTAGLALATDLASEETRPRVVALLYLMLLIGMIGSALIFAALLKDFGYVRLIQVIQSAAVITLFLNVVAMFKQEVRRPDLTAHALARPTFSSAWRDFITLPQARRLLWALGLGTMGFTMQDILLEPYGAQVLALSVSGTTMLTAIFAGGMVLALMTTSRSLANGTDPILIASIGVLFGVAAFSFVCFSALANSRLLFQIVAIFIGFGHGLFAVGMLTAAMMFGGRKMAGLTLGAWGAVQATATGVAVFSGGAIRDLVGSWGEMGLLGMAMRSPAAGYLSVYVFEIALLFLALASLRAVG